MLFSSLLTRYFLKKKNIACCVWKSYTVLVVITGVNTDAELQPVRLKFPEQGLIVLASLLTPQLLTAFYQQTPARFTKNANHGKISYQGFCRERQLRWTLKEQSKERLSGFGRQNKSKCIQSCMTCSHKSELKQLTDFKDLCGNGSEK